jgi:hypothetical protein
MKPHNENAPTRGRSRGANQNNFNSSIAPLENLLNRLESVRPCGEGYRADCPNGHRSRGNLSIKQCDDGRILIHCFSGCSLNEILDATGLRIADIMPERINYKSSPQQVKKWRQDATHRDWAEFAKDFGHECLIVYVAGLQLCNNEPLNSEEMDRLKLALKRIGNIKGAFNGKS